MKKQKCPRCKKATKSNYYRKGEKGTFIAHKKSVYCGNCQTVYKLKGGKIVLSKHAVFDSDDIVIFLTNKKLQQISSRGVVDIDIEKILKRIAGKGIKEQRFVKTLFGFVNEYLREQQA